MEKITIKYIRWSAAFKNASSDKSTIAQINTINQVDYNEDVTTEEVALLQYKINKVYFFTFYCNEVPQGFVDYNNNCFKVGYLDRFKREHLYYSFVKISSGKLFLSKAQFWEFEGESDKKSRTEIFVFTESGDVKIHKVNVTTREAIQLTSKEPIDVSGFYEDFPDFGEYDRLIRKDRMDSLNLSIEKIT